MDARIFGLRGGAGRLRPTSEPRDTPLSLRAARVCTAPYARTPPRSLLVHGILASSRVDAGPCVGSAVSVRMRASCGSARRSLRAPSTPMTLAWLRCGRAIRGCPAAYAVAQWAAVREVRKVAHWAFRGIAEPSAMSWPCSDDDRGEWSARARVCRLAPPCSASVGGCRADGRPQRAPHQSQSVWSSAAALILRTVRTERPRRAVPSSLPESQGHHSRMCVDEAGASCGRAACLCGLTRHVGPWAFRWLNSVGNLLAMAATRARWSSAGHALTRTVPHTRTRARASSSSFAVAAAG